MIGIGSDQIRGEDYPYLKPDFIGLNLKNLKIYSGGKGSPTTVLTALIVARSKILTVEADLINGKLTWSTDDNST